MLEPLKMLVASSGIHSQSIIVLAKVLHQTGDVLVVASNRQKSAIVHSFTLHRTLSFKKIKRNSYAVDGNPADWACLDVNVIFLKQPQLIVPEINKGGNLGDDVTYSGTVSAAFEGTLLGIPSFAISLASRSHFKFHTVVVRGVYYTIKKGFPNYILPQNQSRLFKGVVSNCHLLA